MAKIRERNLTVSLLHYLQAHFSIVGFVDGPIIKCKNGEYINRAGPQGVEINRNWISYQEATLLCCDI